MRLRLRLNPSALFLLLSIVFASDLVAIKVGLGGASPLLLAGLRYVLSGLVLLLIIAAVPKSRLITQRKLLDAFFLGLLATIEFACLYLGMQYISAGETSILYYTQPIFVALLATLFLKEPFSLKKACALVFGFVGMLLIFLENLSTSVASIGGLLVLSSAVTWAGGTVLYKKLVGGENFLPVTSVLLISSGVFLLAFSPLFEISFVVSFNLVLTLVYLIVVCSAFGIALYYYLLKHHEATRVSIWLFLVPVFGVLLGWLVLGEQVHFNAIVGIVCVGVGILVLNK
jgi:drug/metabolite transporter (DMT)-like permease